MNILYSAFLALIYGKIFRRIFRYFTIIFFYIYIWFLTYSKFFLYLQRKINIKILKINEVLFKIKNLLILKGYLYTKYFNKSYISCIKCENPGLWLACYAIRIDRFEQRVIVALRRDSSLTINYYDQEGKSLLEEYYKKRENKKIF